MANDPQAAIHQIRMRRIQKAAEEVQAALNEGRAVSDELLQASGLLARGVDPRGINATAAEVERLLDITRQIEMQAAAGESAGQRNALHRRPI